MAYKALYRTYRPYTFDQVAGQEHIVRTLQNAVDQNKIAHAYLFCGPRGTGKTSIAKIFAKAVNCTSENKRPCMECENCLEITEGSHPDIVEIDAASNNGVEEVRSLIEKVKYAPIKGRYKVYIIDEVHMMSSGAFNALLKTIEEPPAHVIFILATTEPHKVLPTIISRCQRYDFTKVSDEDIIHRIKFILKEENITCEDEVIRIVAQLSDGGMRDALSIMDQCIAYAQDDIKVHHINEIYGITTIKEKIELFNYIYQKEAGKLIDKINSLMEKGIDIKRLTMDLIDILKESVIFDYTKDASLLHALNKDEAELVVNGSGTKKRLSMIDVLMETYDKYRNAANVGSYFEVCLLKMMSIDEQTIVQTQPVKQNTPVIKQTIVEKPVYQMPNVSRETSVPVKQSNPQRPMQTAEIEVDDHVENYYEPSIMDEIPEMIDNKTAHPLDDEFVLELLVGANKPEKQQDLMNFQRIPEYAFELKWAKAANLLKSGKIMASGSNYLILTMSSQAEANEINEKDSMNEFAEFSKELLQKTKKIFAVTAEQQKRVTNNFVIRRNDGTLPAPAVLDVKEVLKKKETEVSNEEIIVNLFGKENIIITED